MDDSRKQLSEEAIRDALREVIGSLTPEQRDALRGRLAQRIRATEEHAVER